VDYYPGGTPREISEYVEDLLEGGVFRFNEKGEMIERLCYEKGRQKPCPETKKGA
jgi:antitoxin component YwqK of YwqJK toxin-antitoxin module